MLCKSASKTYTIMVHLDEFGGITNCTWLAGGDHLSRIMRSLEQSAKSISREAHWQVTWSVKMTFYLQKLTAHQHHHEYIWASVTGTICTSCSLEVTKETWLPYFVYPIHLIVFLFLFCCVLLGWFWSHFALWVLNCTPLGSFSFQYSRWICQFISKKSFT